MKEFGKEVINAEIDALKQVADTLDESFDRAVDAVLKCSGNVIISGVGKPWFIAQKISATLASTGTLSFPLHPADALHGDIGRIRHDDVIVILSNSGSSDEITRMIPVIKQFGAIMIAITSKLDSPLGMKSDIVLNLGNIHEACPLGLAPSASSTALLALGDALALAVLKARNFTKEDYAKYHPAGALGRKLMLVGEIMRDEIRTPILKENVLAKDAIGEITRLRAGAAYIVSETGSLIGIFTDGDLRRNLQAGTEFLSTQVISPDALISEALKTMKKFRIDEIPVVNSQGILLGHIDVQDILDLGLALD